MPLSQTGATYSSRTALANPPSDLKEFAKHVLQAADDLASQVQAVRSQGNFGEKGAPPAPHPLTNILVKATNGFATITLTHSNPPAGATYQVEYSTTSNFQDPVRLPAAASIDSGVTLTLQQYLKGQTLYFRGAPKFPASPLAPWIYFGGAANPTAVSF